MAIAHVFPTSAMVFITPTAGGRGSWGTPGPSLPHGGQSSVSGRPVSCPADPGNSGERNVKTSMYERQVKSRLQVNQPSGTSVTEGEESGVNWTKTQQIQSEETPVTCLKI